MKKTLMICAVVVLALGVVAGVSADGGETWWAYGTSAETLLPMYPNPDDWVGVGLGLMYHLGSKYCIGACIGGGTG